MEISKAERERDLKLSGNARVVYSESLVSVKQV